MNIHLIRDSDFSQQEFDSVVSILHKYPGPVKFIGHEKPVEYKEEDLIKEEWENERARTKVNYSYSNQYNIIPVSKASWGTIFIQCDIGRIQNRISVEEPVVLLTHQANELNWFQGADPSGKKNIFVQTSMWDLYIKGEAIYPVAYQIASIPLKILMYDDFNERVRQSHREPRGCLNDFCGNKTEIMEKLLKVDVCSECRQIIEEKQINKHILRQVFAILEGIRKKISFYTILTENPEPVLLKVHYQDRTFILPDLNIELPFDAMEMTVYHFFLNHPEGISYSTLPNDHYNELYNLYWHYCDTEVEKTIEKTVKRLCNNKDTMSNVVTRIRSIINENIPEHIAGFYVIDRKNGRKQRISIDRQYVKIIYPPVI